jgi:hypothetical protein
MEAAQPVKKNNPPLAPAPIAAPAPLKPAVLPSWRDKIEAPVIKSKEEIKIETPKPQPAPVVEIPPAKKVSAPAFYFDVKDEEEAKEFKDDELAIARDKKEQLLNLGAAKIARQIKDAVPEIKITSPEDLVRLSKIVASRLRDIRSLVNTKDSLMKKTESGGLSVTPEVVDKIIKIIEKEKMKWREKPEEYIKTETNEQHTADNLRQTAYNRQSVEEKLPKWKENLDANSEEIGNPQLEHIIAAIKAGSRPPVGEVEKSEIKKQKPETEQTPTVDNREDFSYQSYLMKEKRDRRVMGPVEELLNIDLKEFRALGRSPKEAVNKIYEKIIALAHDSLEERAKGIVAWKSSPLYQQYVGVGEEGLIKSLPIEGILKNRPGGLTWDEFQAIGDLNEQLNY